MAAWLGAQTKPARAMAERELKGRCQGPLSPLALAKYKFNFLAVNLATDQVASKEGDPWQDPDSQTGRQSHFN